MQICFFASMLFAYDLKFQIFEKLIMCVERNYTSCSSLESSFLFNIIKLQLQSISCYLLVRRKVWYDVKSAFVYGASQIPFFPISDEVEIFKKFAAGFFFRPLPISILSIFAFLLQTEKSFSPYFIHFYVRQQRIFSIIYAGTFTSLADYIQLSSVILEIETR